MGRVCCSARSRLGVGEETQPPPLRWSRAPRIDTPIQEALGRGLVPVRKENPGHSVSPSREGRSASSTRRPTLATVSPGGGESAPNTPTPRLSVSGMPLQGDLQIRVSEVSSLEQDWSPVRGGAGVGQAVGEVELGLMAPALAVGLEGSHRPPGNGIADRHHRNPGRGQEGVVQILRDRDRETEDARDVDRRLETDMRAGLSMLAGLDAGEEGRRLGLISQDGDDGGGVDEHRSARPHRVALGVAQRGGGRPIRLR